MTVALQSFAEVQSTNISNLVSSVSIYISPNSVQDKFDRVWDKTDRELSKGNKRIYKAFSSCRCFSIFRVRKYLKEASPYNWRKYNEGDFVSFGYGYCTKYSKYLTVALLTFLKNYYGETKANKIIQYELWRSAEYIRDIQFKKWEEILCLPLSQIQ